MNKTVTVNIGGMVFHIEEQAYEKLKRYLEAIRGYFTTSDGRDEIIQDIESRIAEMFTERIGSNRQVVVEADVEFMIDTMGRPEQVAGESDNDKTTSTETTQGNSRNLHRRLYRDPDDKVIGGVCSGISYYLGIDPIWLRLIFAIVFFAWGSGLLVYLLLIVIIPKAKTTAEKLEMKGQPVNIDNIKKSIQDEVEDLKARYNNGDLKNSFRSSGTIPRFFEMLGQLLIGALRVFVKILGVILIITLIFILIGLFLSALGMAGFMGNVHIPVFMTQIFLNSTQVTLGIIALVLIIGIPTILLLYKLVRLIFNIKSESRILNITSGILWATGLIIGIFLSVSISQEFRIREQQRSNLPIAQPTSGTLYIDLAHPRNVRDESYYDDNFEIQDGYSVSESKDTVRINSVKLDVIKSDGPNFELVQINSGRGSNRKEAQMNIRSIQYEVIQDDSILKFNENFTLPKNIRYRNQKIQLILKVPVGKSVHFGNDIDEVIYDVKNVTNTYDGDMVGKTWTMTDNGLACLGCNLSDTDKSDKHKMHVRVNGEDVDISSDDNRDTINWDNKDVKIHINGQGVVIDAKEKK